MDNEKIGIFIKKLREKENFSQSDLAQKLNISRQAISKWERGITIPDASTLLLLSEIFKVSINEILIGDYITSENKEEIENLTLNILEEIDHKKKILKRFMFIILFLIFCFLTNYFFNSYNRFQAYLISGKIKNEEIMNGILVKMDNKCYLRLSSLNSSLEFSKIELYYKENNKKNIIYESTNNNLSSVNMIGFNFKEDFIKINKIIKNLYLDIYNDDIIKSIKLEFKKDYSNSFNGTTSKDEISSNDILDTSLETLISKLESSLFLTTDSYLQYNNINLIYSKNLRTLELNISDLPKEYNYVIDLEIGKITYKEYDNQILVNTIIFDSNTCLENCNDEYLESIKEKLNKELEVILN